MNPRCEKRGHLWKVLSPGPKLTGEKCSRCELTRERQATVEEKLAYRKWVKDLKRVSELHKLGHAFERALEGKSGYEAMEVADRWEAKHPNRIRIASVDDNHFASSYLVFLTREDPKGGKWMGVSVYYIPQCTGENPVKFFLYPGDASGLLNTLKTLVKASRAYPEVRRFANLMAKSARKRDHD